ncbi:hypothetical protein OIU77_003022 [Salix suchowensis]|uniref:Uncharacterized protein n=1 Tax=Salix suchowensis TaxID=1278906 RepID=A0ABQ9AY93_9ROSI|nr:hypothetical protein OIU77_003022 [Salix suchowensis]
MVKQRESMEELLKFTLESHIKLLEEDPNDFIFMLKWSKRTRILNLPLSNTPNHVIYGSRMEIDKFTATASSMKNDVENASASNIDEDTKWANMKRFWDHSGEERKIQYLGLYLEGLKESPVASS